MGQIPGDQPNTEPGDVNVPVGAPRDVVEWDLSQAPLDALGRLLEAVARAGRVLLTGSDIDAAVGHTLEILGQTTGVDRISVFEHHPHPDTAEAAVSRRYLWAHDPATERGADPLAENFVYGGTPLAPWYERLLGRNIIQFSTLDAGGADSRLLQSRGVQSLLAVPMIVEDAVWGLMTFSTRRAVRRWEEHEPQILAIAACGIAGAILRHRVQDALRQSQAESEALLATVPDVVLSLDEGGTIIGAHAGDPSRVFPVADVQGHTLEDLVPASLAAEMLQCVRRALETGSVQRLEYELQTPDGPREYEARGVRSGPGEVLALIRDITEQKRLQAHMAHVRREEDVLTLAAGLAHDFNNLLVGVLSNASLLEQDLPTGSEAFRICGEIQHAGQRLSDLTKQLLNYAGASLVPFGRVDVNAAVRESFETLVHLTSADVVVRTDLAEDLWHVDGDRAQLREVFVHLGLNAVEATADRGQLTVTTRNRPATEAAPVVFPHTRLAAREYVEITVHDTGHGMDAETLDRIFEPFYSTKFIGRGLGLSSALGVISKHDGGIAVETVPGEGTTMRVFIPRGELERETQPAGGLVSLRATGTVLIADDESLVRRVAARALERHGYNILTAATGKDAITLFEAHAPELVCALVDLRLPDLNGMEVCRRFHASHPDVPVALCSGFDEHTALSGLAGRDTLAGFLQKPYTMLQLTAFVRRVTRILPD